MIFFVSTSTYRCFNSVLKTLDKIFSVLPVDTIILPDVKMKIVQVILLTCPNNRQAQSHGKSSLEVHSAFVLAEICNDKTALFYIGYDSIIYLSDVLDIIHSVGFVSGCLDGSGESLIVVTAHFRRE